MENISEKESQKSQIFVRLGIIINADKEDVEKVIQGDERKFTELIAKRKFFIDGESYIPYSAVEYYNEKNGTQFEEEDIEFQLSML